MHPISSHLLCTYFTSAGATALLRFARVLLLSPRDMNGVARSKLARHGFFSISRRMSNTAAPSFPVTASIKAKLTAALKPSHLEVINESHMHNVPVNSETHFKVLVVSDQFEALKTPLQRHRLVNATLEEELAGPVHALSIIANTPKQWEAKINAGKTTVEPSPSCRGGDGSLPSKSGK